MGDSCRNLSVFLLPYYIHPIHIILFHVKHSHFQYRHILYDRYSSSIGDSLTQLALRIILTFLKILILGRVCISYTLVPSNTRSNSSSSSSSRIFPFFSVSRILRIPTTITMTSSVTITAPSIPFSSSPVYSVYTCTYCTPASPIPSGPHRMYVHSNSDYISPWG